VIKARRTYALAVFRVPVNRPDEAGGLMISGSIRSQGVMAKHITVELERAAV
jgi:hypothetical protein